MSLAMPDSITVADLPPGYGQYLGYADGAWPTAAELRKKFPAARVVSLTVTGGTLDADGIDCEPGNPNAASSADWVARKLAAAPGVRPVVYASVQGTPGYGMPDVIHELGSRGIARTQVRLITAHYSHNHICGPATCNLIGEAMDGTQWTDTFRTETGAAVDMSALRDDFFGGAQPPQTGWTEALVHQLATVKAGDTGEAVRTAQGALAARHYALAIDGMFGPQTDNAVRQAQSAARIGVDGIVGQQTWPVLLGIA